jgi:hypothetical protein
VFLLAIILLQHNSVIEENIKKIFSLYKPLPILRVAYKGKMGKIITIVRDVKCLRDIQLRFEKEKKSNLINTKRVFGTILN